MPGLVTRSLASRLTNKVTGASEISPLAASQAQSGGRPVPCDDDRTHAPETQGPLRRSVVGVSVANGAAGAGHVLDMREYSVVVDQDLWLLVRDQDDAAAFGALFDRHVHRVYNFCFRRTADWSAAEDLVSVVFLTAWRRRHDVVVGEEGCGPWLITVAAKLTLNHVRQLKRHRALINKLPAEPVVPDLADDVVARLYDEASMAELLGQIRRLPPLEQEAIALCCFAELSPTDAAIALGVPAGTVRSRLSRARIRLRGESDAAGQSCPHLRVVTLEKE